MDIREKIARRVAMELKDGDVVNLGIGIPTTVADVIPEGVHVVLQSENGILGMEKLPNGADADKNVINAGGVHVSVRQGGSYFDSATSFSIIRGGHVDLTVLGALQVDETGSLASHIIPGKMVPGMGGAMDLVTGSKKVIVTMSHTAKDLSPKILKKINLPATAINKVNMIVTELAVIEVTKNGLVLKEVAAETTVDEVIKLTEANLIVADNIKTF